MKFCIAGLCLLCMAIIAGCGGEDDPVTATPPVFSVAPVNLVGPYNAQTKTFGSISFAATSPALVPFGAEISTNSYTKVFDYYPVLDAPVVAVCEGIVSAVFENPFIEGDYEIQVTVTPGADFTVIYDHVNQVRIQEALLVKPGDTLGVAGNWSDAVSRFSLGITTGEGVNQRWYCPMNYGDSTFKNLHQQLLQAYNAQNIQPYYDTVCAAAVIGPGN